MSSVTLEIVTKEFHCFTATRVQQGEISAGPQPQITLLRSCTCVGFFNAERKIGAISHITGFSRDGGHDPAGALNKIARALSRFGLKLHDCECFIVGGSEAARHVYDAVLEALAAASIPYRELDILGRFHRKLLFDPATGHLTLLKKAEASTAPNVTKVLDAKSSLGCFHNPKDRLLTGASLLFRNRPLLDWIRRDVLDKILANGNRLHVWCAGCSIGMEAYSVAMVILDWLETHQKASDFIILGTDISEEALQMARTGVYPVGKQGFRGYESLVEKYTEPLEELRLRMRPELRKVVVFKQKDIRLGSRKHRFELIICDHVLQYFDEDVQMEFIQGMLPALQPRGFLYLSTPSHAVPEAMLKNYPLEHLGRHIYRLKR